jgi:hypothetical protein
MCGPSLTVRRVLFSNIINHQLFTAQLLNVQQLNSVNDTVPTNLIATAFTSVPSRFFPSMEPEVETPFTWSLPYVTGQVYAVWWGTGIDFSHISIYTSPNFPSSDPAIIFKFNYSQNR